MRVAVGVLCASCVFVFAHGSIANAADGANLTNYLPLGQAVSSRELQPGEIGATKFPRDGLSATRVLEVLQKVEPDTLLLTRGAKEAQIYRTMSPSVVLIATVDSLGSGSVIAEGKILTNWHVIAGATDIGIIFKPEQEGEKISSADLIRAELYKADPTSDLALLTYPSHTKSFRPMELGSQSDIEVGADVSAIGHPTGEAWTYTRGVISQFRKDYEWRTEDQITHKADVIQTQTPINPGNSGGPLISNGGKLIGVNAFKAEGEGLNFAISISTIRKFVSERPGKGAGLHQPDRDSACAPKVLYEGRDRDNTSFIRLIDASCRGKADMLYRVPDDKKRSIALLLDTSGNGNPDIWIYDWNRDGKWDYSLHSIKHDGHIDLIGYHPDGKIMPTRYEAYRGQPTPWAN